jgi:voltage-gated potassium channel Kch
MSHVSRFILWRLQRAFETGRILPYLMTTIAGLAVLAGVLMWLVDREDFPSLGLALWWAVTTVTTVGYGDAVPEEPAGRALAAGLMIFGFASLSLLTGIVASLLVHRRTAGDAKAESVLVRIDERLAEVERLLRDRPPG